MSAQPEPKDTPQPAKRGDAAWREQMQAVAERNDAAKKAGKQERQKYEKARETARQVAERRREGKSGL